MKSIFRVMRVFSLFGLIFLLSSLNSYALAKGPEKSGEEALKAGAEKALQAKVERLKSDYKDAVSLYNQGRRQEARNRFLRIAADAARNDLDPSNDLYLGYWVERGLRRYLQRSEQKIGQATEAEPEARKKAEAEKKLEVEAGRQAEDERAYKEKVKKVLQQDFQTAERFYKQGRFLEAKSLLEKIARQKEATGVSLGLLADRRLKSYLSNIDKKIAQKKEERPRKKADETRWKAEEEARTRKKAAEAERQEEQLAKLESQAQLDQQRKKRLAKIESALGSALPTSETGGPLAGKVLREEKVLRERYEKVLSEELKRAKALIEEEKYEEALTHLKNIETQIQFAPIPPSDVIDEIKKELKVLLPQVQAKAKEAQRLRHQEELERARAIAEREREKWEEIREEQIFEEIELAKLFMERKEFDKAEAILKAILIQDPTEPRALVLLEVVKTEKHMDEMAKLREVAEQEFRKQREFGVELTTPWREIYIYPPPDIWRALTERRREAPIWGLEPPDPADLRIEENLKRRITFDFTDYAFIDYIDFIRDIGDINIVIDSAVVLPADMFTLITLRLTDVTIESALKYLLSQMFPLALDFVIKDGVLFISDEIGVEQVVEPVQAVYDIQDLTAPIRDFVGPALGVGAGVGAVVAGAGEEGVRAGDGGRGGRAQEPWSGYAGEDEGDAPGFGDASSTEKMDVFAQEAEELGFEEEGRRIGVGIGAAAMARAGTPDVAGRQIVNIIRRQIDPDVWDILDNSIIYRSGQLFVTAPPSTHRKIQRLLQNLRRARAIQVSMDIRFIRCTDEFLEQVGVQIWAERTGHTTYYGDVISNLEYSVGTGVIPLTAPFSYVSGEGGTSYGLNILTEHVWDNWTVGAFLNLVQKSRQAQVTTAPRLTVMNGQSGQVSLTEVITYISKVEVDVDTSVSNGTVLIAQSTSPTTATVNVGVVFSARPTVSSDRRYVSMELMPQLTDVTFAEYTYISSQIVNSTIIETPTTIKLPHTYTTQVQDTVSVPDGGTIIAGGVLKTQEITGEVGIPVLSKLPLIGWLFGMRAETYTMDHTLILVTPHIILQEEEEEAVLKEAL